jgi:signal transduction histidine kinase
VRRRLTLATAGVLAGGTAAVLALSWWLIARHLDRTVPAVYADGILAQLGTQYALAVAGATLVGLGLAWAIAGHALAPVRAIAGTARRITDERLDARVGLAPGPRAGSELHELAGAFDAMLDRVQGSVDAQRRFVANASHELRTPITVIRTEGEVVLDDPDATADDLREVVRSGVATAERTEELLDGLLVLAATTQGARRDDPVDLADVARRAVAAARPEAAAAGVLVRLDAHEARVRGDAALLERLVGNLVENAVRHGAAGGHADVRIHGGGDTATVRVVNGGRPIPPALVPRLTQPFERLGRAQARGTGLGLSIVRAVAEAHGGTLALAAPPTGGLEAEVRLPTTTSTH